MPQVERRDFEVAVSKLASLHLRLLITARRQFTPVRLIPAQENWGSCETPGRKYRRHFNRISWSLWHAVMSKANQCRVRISMTWRHLPLLRKDWCHHSPVITFIIRSRRRASPVFALLVEALRFRERKKSLSDAEMGNSQASLQARSSFTATSLSCV
jgi:hypothetical protein